MSDGYRTQSPDTSREAEEMQFAHWRKLTPAQKAAAFTGLMKMVGQLARVGIRMRHPGAAPREVELRVMALRVEREAMIKHCGWDPEREGY